MPVRPGSAGWFLFPASVAAIAFVGGVATNLVSADIEPLVRPYKALVWTVFVLALLAAVAGGILQARTPRQREAIPSLQLEWDAPAFGLSSPEHILVVPGGSHGPSVWLRNNGPGGEQITRLQLDISVHSQVTPLVTLNQPVHFDFSEDTVLGLEWQRKTADRWMIDTPFVLNESAEIELINLGFPDKDSEKLTEQLVGRAGVEVVLDLVIHTQHQTLKKSLRAPLRILRILKRFDDDGGVARLVSGFDAVTPDDRTQLAEIYQEVRRYDQRERSRIANDLNQAQEKENLENLADEIAQYDEQIELEPSDAMAHGARGRFLWEQGLPRLALQSLNTAYSLGLREQSFLMDRARVLLALDRAQEALDTVDSTRPDDTPTAGLWAVRGQAQHELARYEDALASYDRSIALSAKSLEAHMGRGLALMSLERSTEALDAFDAAAQLNSDDPSVQINRALVLPDLDREDEAVAAIELAIAKGFQDLELLKRFEDILPREAWGKLRTLLESEAKRG